MAITSSTIDLEWTPATDNVGVTGYRVYNNANDALIADVGNVLSFTVGSGTGSNSPLAPNTQYSFYNKAYDAAGNVSLKSNIVTATTLP